MSAPKPLLTKHQRKQIEIHKPHKTMVEVSDLADGTAIADGSQAYLLAGKPHQVGQCDAVEPSVPHRRGLCNALSHTAI
jgi:hypothetical protein